MSEVKCWEVNEAMATALGLVNKYKENPESFVEAIEDMFHDAPLETAQKLVRGLIPMAFHGRSGKDGTMVQGFGVREGRYFLPIVQQEYKG